MSENSDNDERSCEETDSKIGETEETEHSTENEWEEESDEIVENMEITTQATPSPNRDPDQESPSITMDTTNTSTNLGKNGAYPSSNDNDMHYQSEIPIVSVDQEIPSAPIVTATVLIEEYAGSAEHDHRDDSGGNARNPNSSQSYIYTTGEDISVVAQAADVVIDGPHETAELIVRQIDGDVSEKDKEIDFMRRTIRRGVYLIVFLLSLILGGIVFAWARRNNGTTEEELPPIFPLSNETEIECFLCPNRNALPDPFKKTIDLREPFRNLTCGEISDFIENNDALACPGPSLLKQAAHQCGCEETVSCTLCPDGNPPPNRTAPTIDTQIPTCGEMDDRLKLFSDNKCYTNTPAIMQNSYVCGCPGVAPVCIPRIDENNQCGALLSHLSRTNGGLPNCDCYNFCDGNLLDCYSHGTIQGSVCSGELVSGCNNEDLARNDESGIMSSSVALCTVVCAMNLLILAFW